MPRIEEIDFSAFNKAVNMDELKKELTDLKSGKDVYEDVPDDKYFVKVASMSIGKQKSDPTKLLFKVSLEILEGQYKKRRIFWNQGLMTSRGIHTTLEFLRSLDIFDANEVEWHDDYGDLNSLVLDVAQYCDEQNRQYVVEYSHNDKGYANLKVEKAL